MFKVIKNPTFTAKVNVSVPTEGGQISSSFTGRFKAISVTEAEKFNLLSGDGTTEYLRAIFIGWGEDLVDEDGQPIAFCDAARDELIDIPFVRVGILNSFNAAMMGAKRGN